MVAENSDFLFFVICRGKENVSCYSLSNLVNNDIFTSSPFLCVKCLSQSVSSVAQSCPTLCGPMNRSTPGLPVHHQLPEFTQTHVHRVGDAIQPSHPLSSPSPPAPNSSQHQGASASCINALFQLVHLMVILFSITFRYIKHAILFPVIYFENI